MDSCARPAGRFRPPAAGGRGSAGQNILGLILGVAFTLGLFLSIAHYEKAAPESPPPELDDLRVAVVPVQPPPLPSVTPTESAPDTTPMVDFEYAPSDSVVKIAASPPSAASVLPEELSRAPSANASFDFRPADFKPRMAFSSDSQHVYQRNEVDRAPEVLERPNTPPVPQRIRNNAAALQVTLFVVVNASGAVGDIRLKQTSGSPGFDSLMIDFIRQWVFSPAIKGGKKVRCLIEQGITIKWSGGSPFQT